MASYSKTHLRASLIAFFPGGYTPGTPLKREGGKVASWLLGRGVNAPDHIYRQHQRLPVVLLLINSCRRAADAVLQLQAPALSSKCE